MKTRTVTETHVHKFARKSDAEEKYADLRSYGNPVKMLFGVRFWHVIETTIYTITE